jgi:pyruvate/2-oxoglutarate dehydrogenase complex dihydrolipoamide dehydrogenase (E3) component
MALYAALSHFYVWQHAIDSDGFFRLDSLPKRVAVVGAGYIAVELVRGPSSALPGFIGY